MTNATGPWIRGSDQEPPKDGRMIMARWRHNNKPFTISYHIEGGYWLTSHNGRSYNSPDYWAEINEPEG